VPSLLVILLVISLVVVSAGLLLSYKPGTRVERYVSPTRIGREVIVVDALPPRPRMRSVAQPKQPIVRRSSTNLRRYHGASAVLPLVIDHDFEEIRTSKPIIPWTRVISALLVAFLFVLFFIHFLLPSHSNWNLIMWYGNSTTAQQSSSQSSQFNPQFNASRSLVRLSQLDPSQYVSHQEFTTWAYSACSTASLTEVMNAYGRHYRVTDVLKIEASIGEITPQLGLLHEVGIQKTAAQFGFKTTWGHNLSLDQIISIANQGRPVIVDFPPDRYAGGHLLVVTGGNSSIVKLADSSLWNRRSLSRSQFLQWWEGFYAIVTPK
jgi:Peptidase_C39 like family